jgi:hypothetical protein
MTANELNINKEMIRQSSTKIYRRGRLMGGQKQWRLSSCQGFIQTCQDNPSFRYCIFLFPNVKNALKGNGFQNVDDIKKNSMADLNTVPL